MKFAIVSLVALATAVSAQTITLNTPSGANAAIQCEIFQITWTGGAGPFTIRLNDPSNNFIEEIGSNINASPFPWTVNEPSGQEFGMVILDSQGNTGLSGQFIVQPNSVTSCLTGGNSTSASGSATPASTASGASTPAAGESSASVAAPTSRSSASSGSSGTSAPRPASSASQSGSAAAASQTKSSAMTNTASAGLIGALLAAVAAIF